MQSGYIRLKRMSASSDIEDLPSSHDDLSNGQIRIQSSHANRPNLEDEDEEDLIMQSIKRSPYDDDLWLNEAEANALGKYDDFHTIDWSRDRMRDRIRFRKVKKMKYQGTLMERIKV
eukprot:TCONS_00051881-protein